MDKNNLSWVDDLWDSHQELLEACKKVRWLVEDLSDYLVDELEQVIATAEEI